MNHTGFIRLAAVQMTVAVANPEDNIKEMTRLAHAAEENGVAVALFPELCISGYTCGDLFFSQQLQSRALEALCAFSKSTEALRCTFIAGLPIRMAGNLYNCAAVVQSGRIAGIVPKTLIPHAGDVDERRWFSSGGAACTPACTVRINDADIPFGSLLFRDKSDAFSFAIEIGNEGRAPVSPGAIAVLEGADAVFNPGTALRTAGCAQALSAEAAALSARYGGAYIRACAGPTESTAEAVHSGYIAIASEGTMLQEQTVLLRSSSSVRADIDISGLRAKRLYRQEFSSSAFRLAEDRKPIEVTLAPLRMLTATDKLLTPPSCAPYIPSDTRAAHKHCLDIFEIQSTALAERLRRAHARTAVIGVSGGSDSTLALLVIAKAMQISDRPASDIVAVSMPGFGTTEQTRGNAHDLMDQLGCSAKDIPIHAAVLQHFKDIGHDPTVYDITYENAQARERTQLLMDIANQTGGFVVGTGDLSEMALGWCTFNGDHMSMYGVNAGLPKGLVRRVIETVSYELGQTEHFLPLTQSTEAVQHTLQAILRTPISPELLPLKNDGNASQQTEDVVGPYELHDFFLYHIVERSAGPKRVLWLAEQAFAGAYDASDIRKWLAVFIRRFFSQQFKRNSLPDGPKLISLSLSPRSGWRMPSDAMWQSWLDEL